LEREASHERRCATLVQSVREARAEADMLQSKLFDSRGEAEERAAAWGAERQILAETNDKHQSSVASLERENDLLRARIQSLSSSGGGDSADGLDGSGSSSGGFSAAAQLKTLAGEADELRNDNARLHKEVLARERSLEAAAKSLAEQGRSNAVQVGALQAEAARLHKDLEKRSSPAEVEALRAQLKALRRLEFNAQEDEDDIDDKGGGLAG